MRLLTCKLKGQQCTKLTSDLPIPEPKNLVNDHLLIALVVTLIVAILIVVEPLVATKDEIRVGLRELFCVSEVKVVADCKTHEACVKFRDGPLFSVVVTVVVKVLKAADEEV